MSKKKIIAVASHGPALTSIQTTMNTTPTTKAKPTAGPWIQNAHEVYSQGIDPSRRVAIFYGEDRFMNAGLATEAGTVYHETGLTPRELVEQRNKLLRKLEFAAEWLEHYATPNNLELMGIKSTIQEIKATE